MIKYSPKARMAYARLFSPYNDVDIFVEDSTYIGIYEKIFKKFLPTGVRLNKVIPLGPKNVVEEKALEYQNDNSRNRLYIVDGDFDLISKYKKNRINNLHTLNVYSLENILCEINSINSYAIMACPGINSTQAIESVNANEIMNNIKLLIPYIISLSIARKLNLHGSSYAINPQSVTKKDEHKKYIVVCGNKVYHRTKSIIRSIINSVGWEKYLSAKNYVRKNFTRRKITAEKIVPGKNFILPIVNDKISKCGGVSANLKMISSYLAESCNLDNDPVLRKKLMSINK